VLVARVGALDEIGLGLDLQQDVDKLAKLDVIGMGAVPAAGGRDGVMW
jgi:hypothetical protein